MTARLGLLMIAPLLIAQPRVQNGRLETRVVSGSLDATLRTIAGAQTGPVWIAYPLSQVERAATSWGECGMIRLEGVSEGFLFLRVESARVERIRIFPADCPIDAGGLAVYSLTGVDQTQSVALLRSLIPATDGRDERRLANQAISAIAQHSEGAPALIELVRSGPSTSTRRQAMFWLSRSKDPRAIRFFEDVLSSR